MIVYRRRRLPQQQKTSGGFDNEANSSFSVLRVHETTITETVASTGIDSETDTSGHQNSSNADVSSTSSDIPTVSSSSSPPTQPSSSSHQHATLDYVPAYTPPSNSSGAPSSPSTSSTLSTTLSSSAASKQHDIFMLENPPQQQQQDQPKSESGTATASSNSESDAAEKDSKDTFKLFIEHRQGPEMMTTASTRSSTGTSAVSNGLQQQQEQQHATADTVSMIHGYVDRGYQSRSIGGVEDGVVEDINEPLPAYYEF
jgi:hypothetical protein